MIGGGSSRLTEHRIPPQRQALLVGRNYMIKQLTFLFLLAGCTNNKSAQVKSDTKSPRGDTVILDIKKSVLHYNLLREDMLNADSVILLSHHSPNMPIRNPKTGEYYKKSIPFIVDDTINYETSVQERKQLNRKETEELIAILTLPAIDDVIESMCFQPRNAIVFFKRNKMSCFDFCFDCYGFAAYGNFRSDLLMNSEKYQKLMALYKKYKFKYELQ